MWLISFMHYDLGFFDHQSGRVECAPNPFSARASTMSPVSNVSDVSGIDLVSMVGLKRFVLSLRSKFA
jgi:hypothetical protein